LKVFVSVDMEGVSGVTDPEDVLPAGSEYQTCRRYMTGDANAAIGGAYDAGAEAVLVNDSHWIMRNLLIHDLDKRAKVIKGFHKPLCMLQGLDDSYGAAVFVGYHSCAGTEGGVLNHTMLGKEVQNIYLNGDATGETRLNAGLAGSYGVPVALVAGDVAVCEEAKRVLPWVETVAVKDGIDKYSAILKHPEVAAAEIRESTARALKNKAFKPYVLKPPITIGIEWNSTTIAETCALIPGVKRMSSRSTEYKSDVWPDAMKVLLVELLLALEVSGGKGIYQ
jgi:D-amino peptidase